MAKSSLSTKNLKEALTPDQVSKVEDKYKSIYSGMLKGDKKKLMKYIDPKLKRANPDAMAMGRAINLVKKETETVNESSPELDKIRKEVELIAKNSPGKGWTKKSIDQEINRRLQQFLNRETVNEDKVRDMLSASKWRDLWDEHTEWAEANRTSTRKDANYPSARKQNENIFSLATKYGFDPIEIKKLTKQWEKINDRTYGAINPYEIWMDDKLTKPINEQMDAYDEIAQSEFGMDYEQLGSGEQEWVRDEINNMELREEPLNEYINPGYQIETKYFDPNEVKAVADQLQGITGIENIQYKEFKWADGTGGLSFGISSDYRDTGLDYLVRLEHTHDGKWKSKVFATYGAGASEVDFGEVDLNIDMEGFTNMKDITKETFRGVWDKMLRAAAPALKSKRREMEVHQSKSNQSQRDFYKDRGQTSGTIDERLATLVKEVYSEKQRKWACAQDGPEFDEMCKDTAISKKKLKENDLSHHLTLGQDYTFVIDLLKDHGGTYEQIDSYLNSFKSSGREDFEWSGEWVKDFKNFIFRSKNKLKEEMTSTVSKARAKSELKQMLKGKRDDGMGKSTLKAVLAIDKDGKETKVKKLEDFDKFEKGTKFSLKETTMNNDRLTELIKAALAGPVKEDNFHSPRTVKNIPIGGEDKELHTVDLDWYERKDKERREKAGADMRKKQNTLKEGVWGKGTVTEIKRFIIDLQELMDKYYDIVGSDDVFDGLDRAASAAVEMMNNSPENRSDLAETIFKKLRESVSSRDIKRIFGNEITDIERTEGDNFIVQGNLDKIESIASKNGINTEKVENWGIRIWTESLTNKKLRG